MNAAPATMQPHERLTGIAELLALGLQRLLAAECKAEAQPRNSRDQLAAVANVEAPCGSRVLNPQSKTA